jgi:hypothetical protein
MTKEDKSGEAADPILLVNDRLSKICTHGLNRGEWLFVKFKENDTHHKNVDSCMRSIQNATSTSWIFSVADTISIFVILFLCLWFFLIV